MAVLNILKNDEDRPVSFSAKNKDSQGRYTIPAGYEINKIELVNSKGDKEENLYLIIEEIKIVESIFSPLLKCVVRFKDNQGFFEKFGISGKEILHIDLDLIDEEANKENIKLTFVSEEYPTFIKTLQNISSQEYICEFISPLSFYSRLQTISRSTNVGNNEKENNPLDVVKDIYKTSLGLTNFEFFNSSKCDVKFKGVITTDGICGCAVMHRSKILRKAGILDEDFFFGPADIELSNRLKKYGKHLVNLDYYAHHKVSQSIFVSGMKARYYFETIGWLLIIKKMCNTKDKIIGQLYFIIRGFSHFLRLLYKKDKDPHIGFLLGLKDFFLKY